MTTLALLLYFAGAFQTAVHCRYERIGWGETWLFTITWPLAMPIASVVVWTFGDKD